MRAEVLLEIGRYREAIPFLLTALSFVPGDTLLLCRLAFAFLKLHEWPEAMRFADEAVHSNPTDEQAHRLRCEIFLKTNEAAKAVNAAEEAVNCNPVGEQSLHALIKALLADKQKQRAEEVAQRMRQSAPDSLWTHDGSALSAMHLRRWEDVQRHCHASLAINPEVYVTQNNLGMALMHLGRYAEAESRFREAARLMPSDQMLHQRILLAKNYQKVKEQQEEASSARAACLTVAAADLSSADIASAKRRRRLIRSHERHDR